jgi:hypothetical protein
MHHFPRGGNLDRRWGSPVPDTEAPISGMQSGDLQVYKPGSLPVVNVDHHMAAQDEAARDHRPRPMESGLGRLGLAMTEHTGPDFGPGPGAAAA